RLSTHLVVAASHDEVVVFIITRREPNILVLGSAVVDEAVLDCALGNPNSDYICPVVVQFRHDTELLERDVGRLNRIVAFNGAPALGFDSHLFDLAVHGYCPLLFDGKSSS